MWETIATWIAYLIGCIFIATFIAYLIGFEFIAIHIASLMGFIISLVAKLIGFFVMFRWGYRKVRKWIQKRKQKKEE